MIEIAAGTAPTTLEGEPLDHNSLHDWLALPVQHFIERHPDKTREQLIREACEVVAELVASCGHNWAGIRPYGQLAMDALHEAIPEKFKAHERVRRQRN
jgi:hypothetical protein